jgi:hypothetical protein
MPGHEDGDEGGDECCREGKQDLAGVSKDVRDLRASMKPSVLRRSGARIKILKVWSR